MDQLEHLIPPSSLARDRVISRIHPSAVISPEAQIAPDAEVGPWCMVGPDVVLEAGVRLISHVVVDGHTTIGAGVVVYPFCTIGLAPQDLKYKGEATETIIGPRTQIREHCTIHRGTVTGSGVTRVGADCLLMAVVHVAHDCAAMVGGASGVEADVIPFGAVLGNRARLTGLNVVGLKRRGIDKAGIHRLRSVFKLLFAPGDDTGTVFADRLSQARAMTDDALVAEMLAFIDMPSKRGLVRSAVQRDDDA
jgi:UDP-N-acetylglucosamine acyltransferase